jgi:hypothetical protein
MNSRGPVFPEHFFSDAPRGFLIPPMRDLNKAKMLPDADSGAKIFNQEFSAGRSKRRETRYSPR